MDCAATRLPKKTLAYMSEWVGSSAPIFEERVS
jgi:hypothetical protein